MFEKIKEKITNQNILPFLLFLIILINFIPLIVLNIGTKASFAVELKPMSIAMAIECIILVLYYSNKVKFTKPIIINIALLSIVTLASIIIQYIAYQNNDYKIFDFANIACKFINVMLLFILIFNVKIEENYINIFMKCIVYMGIIACIQNMILYFQDILANFKIIESTQSVYMCKSFFAHKNQFALFLYISIIATIFLLQKNNKLKYKVFLIISLILFLFNLVLTFSRTGTAIAILFLILWFLFTDRISRKTKLILFTAIAVCGIIFVMLLNIYNPELLSKLLRVESIKNFTGRTRFWEIAKETLFVSPVNFLFGIGRFKAEALIKKYGVTQYHNTYIEFLVSGGILELIYFLSIYVFIIIKLIKCDMDKKYKCIYLAMLICFGIYMCFESLGRFSIGCSDTLCLIFFVTIPLLHANSIVEVKENNKDKKVRIGKRHIEIKENTEKENMEENKC